MNVLSLFDGISCGQIALERAGIKVEKYYASEIKPSAIKCTQTNYPNTIQLGDVTKLDLNKIDKIDLINTIKPYTNKFIMKGIFAETDITIKNIETLRNNQETRQYTPRVLKDLKCAKKKGE